MPAFDDDDLSNYDERPARGAGGMGGEGSWDVEDEGPDERELVPDEMVTVRCTHCRKFIFEDTIRCPYCSHLQLEPAQSKKPLWFVTTVVILIGLLSGFSVTYILGLWPWD
jgi:hypothetical protein